MAIDASLARCLLCRRTRTPGDPWSCPPRRWRCPDSAQGAWVRSSINSFMCLRGSFLTFNDGSQAVEECLEAELEESIKTQVIAVLEGSDHLGEGREAAGFHQFPEGGGAAVHPLVLRLARGGFGVRFHLQVHSQALDMAVEQDVDVEQPGGIEPV